MSSDSEEDVPLAKFMRLSRQISIVREQKRKDHITPTYNAHYDSTEPDSDDQSDYSIYTDSDDDPDYSPGQCEV